jgi:hypothetical protein
LEVRFGRGRRAVLGKEEERAVRQRRPGGCGADMWCDVREEWGGPSFFGWLAATVQQQQRTHIYERRQVAS